MQTLTYILIALIVVDITAGIFLAIRFRRVLDVEERLKKLEDKLKGNENNISSKS